jgi:tRNA 2-selenouridine synthase
LPVVLLEGGYKAYKQTMPSFMGRDWPVVRIGGYTGSAKTEVIQALRARGEQVVDLEGMARHFGSAFGNLHRHPQPSSEHFRNLLAEALTGLDSSRRIWVENESRRIGLVHLPEPFYKRMIACPALEMIRSVEDRVAHLVDMYGNYDLGLLRKGFEAIRAELGGAETETALAALDMEDRATAARIALQYYDRTYEHGLEKRAGDRRYPIELQGLTMEACAERLVAAADEMGL